MQVELTTATQVSAPIAGVIARVLVSDGEQVTVGQGLCVMETVKLETVLNAPRTGRVRVLTSAENAVRGGQPLFVITE